MTLNFSDMMTKKLELIEATTSVKETAKKMKDTNVSLPLSFKQETEQALEKDTYMSNVDITVSGLQQIYSASNTNTPGRQYHTNHTSSEIVLQSLSTIYVETSSAILSCCLILAVHYYIIILSQGAP
jgi:hypothetical protein